MYTRTWSISSVHLFIFPFQFRRGFKKMVMRLGCSLVRMPPGGCTIEDYLRAVEDHINTQVQELCKQAYVWYSK